MPTSRLIHIATTLAVAAFAFAAFFSIRPAAAVSDVSGDWNVRYALSCSAVMTQTGNDLSADIDCGGDITVVLTGTINPTTRAFSLSGDFVGFPIMVNGTASEDGSSLSGTWSAPPLVSEGPFSGARSTSGSAMSLSGSWGLVVENIFSGSCVVALEQDGSELTGDVNCENGSSGTFTGSFDEDSNTFTMTGPFTQFTSLAMDGTVSDDGASFEGTWFIDPSGPGGVLSGDRVGGAPEEDETPTRVRTHATPTTSVTLPDTGAGASGGGSQGWVFAAIAGALALSAASYVAFRRVRP